jgi:hypothetical protein
MSSCHARWLRGSFRLPLHYGAGSVAVEDPPLAPGASRFAAGPLRSFSGRERVEALEALQLLHDWSGNSFARMHPGPSKDALAPRVNLNRQDPRTLAGPHDGPDDEPAVTLLDQFRTSIDPRRIEGPPSRILRGLAAIQVNRSHPQLRRGRPRRAMPGCDRRFACRSTTRRFALGHRPTPLASSPCAGLPERVLALLCPAPTALKRRTLVHRFSTSVHQNSPHPLIVVKSSAALGPEASDAQRAAFPEVRLAAP